MSNSPFVIADVQRTHQFLTLCSTRNLFDEAIVWRDANGLPWIVRSIGESAFAIPLVGPGWCFDEYGKERRKEEYERRIGLLRRFTEQDVEAAFQMIRSGYEFTRDKYVGGSGPPTLFQNEKLRGLRYGRLTLRLIWFIHRRVIRCRRSAFRVAAQELRDVVWGSANSAPVRWRQVLMQLLESLSRLHLLRMPECRDFDDLGNNTAVLTNFADMRGKGGDECDDDCGFHGRHNHITISIGRGFLGCLEQCSESNLEGTRRYSFRRTGRKSDVSLRSIGSSGSLFSVFVPAFLGSPQVCKSVAPTQTKLLQNLTREISRKKKTKNELTEWETVTSAKVPPAQVNTMGRKLAPIVCDLLTENKCYVGFNGNGNRKGRGYKLTTWTRKVGYKLARCQSCEFSEIAKFLEDLNELGDRFQLVAVGLDWESNQWLTLNQLRSAVAARSRKVLRIHLRVYTEADFEIRWAAAFQWQAEGSSQDRVIANNVKAAGLLHDHDIRRSEAADALMIDRSAFSKMMNGERSLSDGVLLQLAQFAESKDGRLQASQKRMAISGRPSDRAGETL